MKGKIANVERYTADCHYAGDAIRIKTAAIFSRKSFLVESHDKSGNPADHIRPGKTLKQDDTQGGHEKRDSVIISTLIGNR